MNRNKLKTYAPQARRDFIQAVTDRATQYGLTAKKIEPMTEQGEVVLIAGKPFPKSVGVKRKKLEARIQKLGFEQTMEAMAYTWFNRLVAIRFMELHGYLEHGFRVLSHPEGHTQPELLEHAQHVDLPGLDQKKVVELKLDGTKEEELYRLLLIAQCNALHKALPFLFESINDEAELLLPDHLLHSDSLLRNLVNEIPEEDWREVEIIGWLYQFYISEKKDEVIGKVVASEDIPAATQLFTPNWIVKYLVQNTLGRQWLATFPHSPLKGQMQYYIEPAEQTKEVQEQLKAITPTSLNPEELTLFDPACGSGHILVEAYDLFKAIYQERGYRSKDIPAFILQKNLFGLEIDDRAAQLASFALMMKARADDRRIFESDAKPNILAFEDSRGLNAADITHALNSPILKEPLPPKEMLFEEIEDAEAGLFSKKVLAEKGHVLQSEIASLLELFENAKTFGSLIHVSPKMAAKLPELEQRLNNVLKHGDLTQAVAHVIKPLLQQARILARQYDVVVANPPYMGGRNLNSKLREYAKSNYPTSKSDLFAVFSERLLTVVKPNCYLGLMTPFTWMFLSTYEDLRKTFLKENSLSSLIQPEYHAFFDSAFVPICCFVTMRCKVPQKATFIRLEQFYGEALQPVKALEAIRNRQCEWRFEASSHDLEIIPGMPIAYWVSDRIRSVFRRFPAIAEFTISDGQNKTGNNARFVRFWWEVSFNSIGPQQKWRFYAKGGGFRRWAGNLDSVVDWSPEARRHYREDHVSRIIPEYLWNKPGITWGLITTSLPSFRVLPAGATFDVGGSSVFFINEQHIMRTLSVLNSCVAHNLLKLTNPTINFQVSNIRDLPIPMSSLSERSEECATRLVQIFQKDWDSHETSSGFECEMLVSQAGHTRSISESEEAFSIECVRSIEQAHDLEVENNRTIVATFGLEGEMSPDVPEEEINLYRSDRAEDIKRLMSYAVGCMMGRYSLDKPGLIYANSGNQGFDQEQYKTFEADEDGIVPVTEFDWFPDDAANRFEKLIFRAWPSEHLETNVRFVGESLSPKRGESPKETIRRYFAADFFKHHLSMYKKRPIYWLFSSGKQRGFQALVYLHRYNEGTLARMRTEYVIPLIGKMTARIDHLADDIAAASSSQHRKRLETEKVTITKQLAEVQAFEEKLRHYADQRINLELDDGVKINYGKFSDPEFGDILAEVKAVCGTKDEE